MNQTRFVVLDENDSKELRNETVQAFEYIKDLVSTLPLPFNIVVCSLWKGKAQNVSGFLVFGAKSR